MGRLHTYGRTSQIWEDFPKEGVDVPIDGYTPSNTLISHVQLIRKPQTNVALRDLVHLEHFSNKHGHVSSELAPGIPIARVSATSCEMLSTNKLLETIPNPFCDKLGLWLEGYFDWCGGSYVWCGRGDPT